MRNILGVLATVMVVYLCVFSPASADDDEDKAIKEYEVKAAFLYNFVKFVTWPGDHALELTHAANICILGDNPFGAALNQFKHASSAQLALNVKVNISDSVIPSCHILFISRSEEKRLSSLLAFVHSYPILTVSEIKGFADSGGIIEMVKTEKTIGLFSNNRINLRINLKHAEAEGLHIDAQLLEIVAEVIR
jgi:YfiR/HmsC-like